MNASESAEERWIDAVWRSDLIIEEKLCCFYLCTVSSKFLDLATMVSRTGVQKQLCINAITGLHTQGWIFTNTPGVASPADGISQGDSLCLH